MRWSFTMMCLSCCISSATNVCWGSSHCSGMESIHEKAVRLHPRASCEQMSGCISIKNLSGPAVTFSLGNFFFLAQPWFCKGQAPHFCFPVKVIHLFCITELVIQQKKKKVKHTVQCLPNSSLGDTVLKFNFDHVVFKPDTITATSWVPPHLLFYEDVNCHLSNHLLPSGHTPPRWKTKDSETKSL